MQTKRAGIYCRISQKDKPKRQDSDYGEPDWRAKKVELQEADCRKLAAANGYEVVATYVDDGISASKFKDRPGWERMLADVKDRKLDVLLATEEERLTRQVMEKETLQLACIAADVTWHTARGGTCDPALADGEFFSTMRGAMARMESSRKAERQRAANAHQRRAGKVRKAGPRPFGYEKNKINLCKPEAELIRWATHHLINGGFMYEVHQHFNDSGITTSYGGSWGYGSIKTVLCRARNAGIIEHEGEPVVTAEWPAIVTPEELGAVRAILASQHPGRRIGAPKSLGGGILLCSACGNTLNLGYVYDRRHEPVQIYRCSGRERMRDDGKRHPSIYCSVADPELRTAVVDSYFTTFGQVKNLPEAAHANRLTELYAQLEEANAGIGRIRASIAAGDFTAREYAGELATLRGQAEEAQRQIDAEAVRSAHGAMLAESWDLLRAKGASIADHAKVRHELKANFDALSLAHKRQLVESLLTVTVHSGTGPKRMEVQYRAAPGLNEELLTKDEPEAEQAVSAEDEEERAAELGEWPDGTPYDPSGLYDDDHGYDPTGARARGNGSGYFVCGVPVSRRHYNILTHRPDLSYPRGSLRGAPNLTNWQVRRLDLAIDLGIDGSRYKAEYL